MKTNSRRMTPGLALAVALGLAGSVSANTVGAFGVATTAAGGSQGCGARADYSSDVGGSLGQSTSPGNISVSGCFTSTLLGTTTPAGLTAAFGQTAQGAQSGSGPVSSSDYASADLANGIVRGSAQTVNGYGAFAIMEYWDTLTFTIPGADSSTQTSVSLSFSLDGTSSGDTAHNEVLAEMQVEPFTGCFCTHGNDFTWGLNAGNSGLSTPIGTLIDNSSFVTWDLTDQSTITDVDFTTQANITLTGANPTLWFATQVELLPAAPPLSVAASDTLDFTHTGSLSLSVPNGTTVQSSSGVFLTATATPEPGAAGLCLAGLAVVLGLMRRRA